MAAVDTYLKTYSFKWPDNRKPPKLTGYGNYKHFHAILWCQFWSNRLPLHFFFFLLHRKFTLTPYNQFSERTEDFWRLSFIWALNSLKHGDSLLWLRWAQCPGIQERMETVNILFVSQMTHHRRLFGNSPAFSLHRSATSVPFYGPRTLRKDRFVEIAFGQVTNEMFLSCKTRRWRLPAF